MLQAEPASPNTLDRDDTEGFVTLSWTLPVDPEQLICQLMDEQVAHPGCKVTFAYQDEHQCNILGLEYE